jgi:hypothetical protein
LPIADCVFLWSLAFGLRTFDFRFWGHLTSKTNRQSEISNPQCPHSYLNATNGSTFVARRAGIKHAIRATVARSTPIATNVKGSLGSTPNNMLVKLSRYFVET